MKTTLHWLSHIIGAIAFIGLIGALHINQDLEKRNRSQARWINELALELEWEKSGRTKEESIKSKMEMFWAAEIDRRLGPQVEDE